MDLLRALMGRSTPGVISKPPNQTTGLTEAENPADKAKRAHRKVADLPTSGPTTPSFWLVSDPDANTLATVGATQPLPADEDLDIVVIGSGITGVSFLHHLVKLLDNNPKFDGGKELKVVMLEAREFCSGATGRNGGHFTPSLFDDFVERSKYNIPDPVDDALRTSKLEQHVLNEVSELIDSNGWREDVDFVEEGHTRLFITPEEEEILRADFDGAVQACVETGGVDVVLPVLNRVKWISREEMLEQNGANYPGVWFPASNVWPIKLVTRIYHLAEERSKQSGVSIRLFTRTPVTSISSPPATPDASASSQPRWLVHTPRATLRTKYVIHATNGYASHLLPHLSQPAEGPPLPTSRSELGNTISSISETNPSSNIIENPSTKYDAKPRAQWISPTRGQIIATRANVPPSKLWRSSWLANWGYEYWFPRYWLPRPESHAGDGDGNKKEKDTNALIILGGGRDTSGGTREMGITDDSTINPVVSKTLKEFLPQTFPGYFDQDQEPELEWTGVMAYTKTLDPMAGPVPSDEGVGKYLKGQYIAAGYSGHGMPRAYGCAEVIAQMVVADIRGEEWELPEWVPPSYLTI